MNKLKSNWTAKVFALIIAIFLWSYVMGDVNPVINKSIRDVSVRLNNIESLDKQALVLMEPKTASISVTVSGQKSDVDRITAANILAEVDLDGYSEGEMKVPVKVSLQNTSYNIKIVSWEAKEILFKFDKVISKEISINVETVGEVKDGYVLEEINKKPQNLIIKGPRTIVDQVTEARAVVDITNRTSSTNMSVPVQLLDDKGEDVGGIEKDPGIIDISVDISRTKTLPIELETINELPENINIKDIKIYPTSVKVKGEEGLEDLEKIKTKAIDINELIGKTSIDVELALPDGVKLVDPKQKISIRYSVEEIVEEEFIFSSADISIRKLNEEYAIKKETLPSQVRVILKGAKSIFDNISKANLKIYIDLESAKLGVNQVDIKLEELQGLTIKSIDPLKTEIEIESLENVENIEE